MYSNKLTRYAAAVCVLCAGFICTTGCRGEPEDAKEKIESIAFDKERAVIKINEEATVRVTVKSDAAKKNETVTYTPVNEGIIEIKEPTNDGFIVKGLRGGTTVITAKSELVTSYFEVVVQGENIFAQYITVAQPVIEITEGERRSTQVSLYGGSALDNNGFVWRLESGKNNIGISVTANIAVVSGLERGHQKIIVSHPKAEYESEILVFVKGVEETVQYISAQSNVVLVANDGQYHDFAVVLVNGKPEDIINFEYAVTEGTGNIEIVANGNVCNVKGVQSGASVIRITHPLAVVEFDIRIIVYDIDIPYIVLDQTFVLLNIGDSVNIGAAVEHARNGILHQNEFSYAIFENNVQVDTEFSIVEVIQNNRFFYIRARRGGTARIVVNNEQAQTSREILVVIRDELVYRDDYYITTSQNVIMTQIGANAVQLNMQLINGNTADANGFEWVVDDGTIITVESAHGIVRGNRAAVSSAFNAVALITPKKVGTAKITVSHPKSEVIAVVMVKVYPKGTFTGSMVNVGLKNPDGSLKGFETVVTGTPKTLSLGMVTGDILAVGKLSWSMEDAGIASINTAATGTVNILNGHSNGLTRMTVDGSELENPYECLILAGDANFIDNASVIYTGSIYQRIAEKQTVRIEIKDSQNRYADSGDYRAEVEDKELLYAVMIKNQLVLQGKAAGETKVRVSHKDAINDIMLNVRIDPSDISMDKPYYISGPEIKGVVRMTPANVNVSLAGAGESELSRLTWRSEDTGVATVMGAGSSGMITGRISGRQTKVWVEHSGNKAEAKFILVYVVENENDLYNKVALGTKKENYLLTMGEEQLITLITNAADLQKKDIQWRVVKKNENDPDVITLEPHYDSAMIRTVAAGNAEIVVSHTDNILPLTIYVSVVDALSGEKVIRGPAVIELIRGESKIVSVEHVNLTQAEVMDIQWSVEGNDPVANIEGNGGSAYLYGLRKGVSRVRIRHEALGYTHYATLVCANTAEELASMYVMGVDASYHTMLIGEQKRIKLSFGSNGFPETAKNKLVWKADDSGVVRVAGQGESVTIVAENPGEGTVTVTDTNNPAVSFNGTLEIKFLVRGAGESALEFRGHEKIVGIVVGRSKQMTMRLYNGSEEVTNYSLWEHRNENDNIININRVDNILDITAKAAGQSYITVRYHNEAEAKILAYTANSDAELDAYYPILVEKSNYLLQIGETATVRIETLESRDAQNFKDVSWGIENASVIESADFTGKKQVVIKGRTEGQCIISVNYKGNVVARIFVTVVGNNAVDMTRYIVTENIIGLVKGTAHSSKIFSNLGGDVSSVLWESLDTNIVTVSGGGETATLTAVNEGEAYVTVSYGSWLKRYILVYVCNTKAQADAYRAMNMENQYHRAGIGETLILPLYFAPNKTDVPTMWIDKYGNKVVEFRELENGAKLEVTAVNEGVTVLEAVNTGLSSPNRVLRIYIEVSKRYNNAPKTDSSRYLTIQKTVYVMNPDERDVELNLSVSGVGYTVEELANVRWDILNGGEYISHFPNGKDCRVRVNQFGQEGDAELRASYVNNEVKIKVIVSRTGLMGFPHIVGENTIRVGLGAKSLVEYNVAEIAAYDKNLFSVDVMQGGNIAGAKFTGNMLEVEGKASGQALLRITCAPVCSEAHYKDVMVIVTTTPNGLVYLTTRDNFSQVRIDEVKQLAVEMAGLDNPGDAGYNWVIDQEDRQYLELSFTGRQAQVKGLREGAGKIVKITVKHHLIDDLFDLVLYVRISNTYINTVYLTTPRNIVSVVEGRSVYLEAELVNGNPGEDGLLQWYSMNKDTASVSGAGAQAVVVGKEVGIARVRVQYEHAVNKFVEILVIVEKDMTSSGIYITSADTLVDIKPGDTREIAARLVGGTDEDKYGLSWIVYTSNPVESGKTVVEIIGNSLDKVFFRGINEGEATVRVSHPKTNYALDITVYVRFNSKVEYGVRNITVDVGKQVVVEVKMPPGTQVQHTASQSRDHQTGVFRDIVYLSPAGATSSNFLTIQGIAEGICVVTMTAVNRVMSDELIVEVRPVVNQLVQYILTPDSIYNMTDWQSASNRAMITGTTVGEKKNGLAFTNADDMAIKWEITGGKDYIGFNDTLAPKTDVTGKMVSVYAKSPGTGEITVTHPVMKEMTNYEKKIYVNVNPYDANFILTPVFAGMQIGQTFTFNASISNVEERYDLVRWEAFPNEKGVEGIRITETSGSNNTGKTAKIEALQDGVFKLKVSFNNTKELEGTVYVEPKKSLEILDESFIKLLPNETRFIGVFVEPEGADVDWHTDYLEFLTVDHNASISREIPATIKRRNRITGLEEEYPLRSKYDPARMPPGTNWLLAITGTEREGYTQLKLTSNYIERMVTINTNYNYQFFMESSRKNNGAFQESRVVRGKPNDVVTIKYNVFPEKDRVSVVPNSWKDSFPYSNGKDIVRNITVDYVNQTINMVLDNCGYAELKFISEYNKEFQLDMVIPVYVYYDRINLQWKATPEPNGGFKSRLDDLSNALYIADHETLYVGYLMNDKYAEGYYGEDIEITGITFASSTTTNSGVWIPSDPYHNVQVRFWKGNESNGGGKKGFEIRDTTNSARLTGNESLINVEYVDELKINYKYTTGGRTPSAFTKTIIVYRETWSRR